jgi:hypothetical protein
VSIGNVVRRSVVNKPQTLDLVLARLGFERRCPADYPSAHQTIRQDSSRFDQIDEASNASCLTDRHATAGSGRPGPDPVDHRPGLGMSFRLSQILRTSAGGGLFARVAVLKWWSCAADLGAGAGVLGS